MHFAEMAETMSSKWRVSFVKLLALAALANCGAVVVDTIYGPVRGKSLTLNTAIVVNSFHGIPYATPPVGELRFKKSEPPEPWSDPIDGTVLPAACSQQKGVGIIWMTHPSWSKFSEDCLYVNVYSPQNATDGPYPVLVWFHGGGFIAGANVQYPGHFLAQHDVVVVTVNYRLGAMGFMSSGDATAPGNWGLWDQIGALEFVRDAIFAFGGNPDKVTISGESAGAASVGLLMLAEPAQGLFHQAILQSGVDLASWAVSGPSRRPEAYTQYVAAMLGCPIDQSADMMDCLRTVPHQNVTDASFDCPPGFRCNGFGPVVDGEVLPDVPLELRRRGVGARVPVIHGHTNDDGSYMTYLEGKGIENGRMNRSSFEETLQSIVHLFAPRFPSEKVDLFEALNFFYSPHPHLADGKRNIASVNGLFTDSLFASPGDQFMKLQHEDVDIYYYNMKLRSANASAIVPEWLGVTHAMDLPYVWGYPFLRQNPNVRLDSQILVDIIRWNDRDAEWTQFIQLLWTNFIKFGNPTPEAVVPPLDGAEAVTWPRYTSEEQVQLSVADDQVTYVEDYRAGNHAFWFDYLPYVASLRNSSMPQVPDTAESWRPEAGGQTSPSAEFADFARNILECF